MSQIHDESTIQRFTRNKFLVLLLAGLLLLAFFLCNLLTNLPFLGSSESVDDVSQTGVITDDAAIGSGVDDTVDGSTDVKTSEDGGSPALDEVGRENRPNATAAIINDKDSILTLSGTANNESLLKVYIDGAEVGQTQANASGEWTLDVPLPTEGDHELYISMVTSTGDIITESARKPLIIPEKVATSEDGAMAAEGDTTADEAAPNESADTAEEATDETGPDEAAESPRPEDEATTDEAVSAAGESEEATGSDETATDEMAEEGSSEGDAMDSAESETSDEAQTEEAAAEESAETTDGDAANDEAADATTDEQTSEESDNASAEELVDVPADQQPQTAAAPDLEDFVGGRIPFSGMAEPFSQVEVVVDNGSEQSVELVSVDANGLWSTVVKAYSPGDYSITARVPGSNAEPAFNFSISNDIEFGSKGDCVGKVPPFGEDRGDTYVVNFCEYFSLIAQRLGVGFSALLQANPQIPNLDRLSPGDILNIP